MKAIRYALCISIMLPLCCQAQILSGTDSAKRFIDTVIVKFKARSYYSKTADWTIISDSVRTQIMAATSMKDAMPTMVTLYRMLGDFHGFVTYNGTKYRYPKIRPKADPAIYAGLIKAVRKGKPDIATTIIEKDYGWLQIPGNNVLEDADVNLLAQRIQDSLAKLSPDKLKGLIIDLRLNNGGNMYPMILGVSNLLGSVKLGEFNSVGSVAEPWGIKEKGLYVGQKVIYQLKTLGSANTALKVVILLSPYTASSGEATAIAFKGRKNTIFIGEKTAGYTTSNDSFICLGLEVFFATGVAADRFGKTYPDNLSPDKEIIGGDDFENLQTDNKIQGALKWLKEK